MNRFFCWYLSSTTREFADSIRFAESFLSFSSCTITSVDIWADGAFRRRSSDKGRLIRTEFYDPLLIRRSRWRDDVARAHSLSTILVYSRIPLRWSTIPRGGLKNEWKRTSFFLRTVKTPEARTAKGRWWSRRGFAELDVTSSSLNHHVGECIALTGG